MPFDQLTSLDLIRTTPPRDKPGCLIRYQGRIAKNATSRTAASRPCTQVVSTLIFATERGPAGLQPCAQLALSEAVNKAASQLAATAKVGSLRWAIGSVLGVGLMHAPAHTRSAHTPIPRCSRLCLTAVAACQQASWCDSWFF